MSKNKELLAVCDVAYAMSLIGGKWKVSILWELRQGPRRLSQLRRALPGVAEGVLIVQLKELLQAGLIKRIDYKQTPPKVTYQLTPIALALLPAIASIDTWGQLHRAQSIEL